MNLVDVTQLHCPESGARMGESNSTHHLLPRSGGSGSQQMVCRYCGETEKALRATAELPIHEQMRKMRGTQRREDAPNLAVGDIIRVDGMKYRVQAPVATAPVTGSLVVEVYSEDAQSDVLYLGSRSLVAVVGRIED